MRAFRAARSSGVPIFFFRFIVVVSLARRHGGQDRKPGEPVHDMWLRLNDIVPTYLEPGPDLVPTAEAAESVITPRTRAIAVHAVALVERM